MNKKILLVDDAPFIREILLHLLGSMELEVVGEASNGEEAIEMAIKTEPDLIFMDLVMPKMNGIDATKEILNKLPRTKIIVCSTVDQEAMVVKALEAGCADYLTKPFNADDIRKAIARVSTSRYHQQGESA